MRDDDVTSDTADVIGGLSLQERAALGSGAGFWQTTEAPGVPAAVLSDGPHGVRKPAGSDDHLGLSGSEPATCFPPSVGLAQSWDPALAERIGAALGDEARAHGVGVLLGPGVNIKRDPRGGRNFEYFSEDPLLAGVLGAAWVRGLQSRGVGASVKHFAANNQEHDRMRTSSEVDPRTLREIYLRAFERIVREARPWTVMSSYNRINGIHAAQNRWLLTDVLRGEWGFDGALVSDWGGVADRSASVAAGLDLQMPGPADAADRAVVEAVGSGELGTADVDRAARNVAALAHRAAASRGGAAAGDTETGHALAREAAARSIVLLQNDGGLLPLAPSGRIAVIGEFAQEPRYQGGGSSHVNPTRVDVPLQEIRSLAGPAEVVFARGFAGEGAEGGSGELRAEAVGAARGADTAVVFLGLSANAESEGFDREHIEIPGDQLALLAEILAVQPRTVVVLLHGGVLRLSAGVTDAPAVLDAALPGQAGGGAIADVLFGRTDPSGRLAETVPVRLQDAPSYLSFPGAHSRVRYAEGLFVGYRWYDARDMEVSFPFGHGLSYTSFAYSRLHADADADGVTVRVRVDNTGARSGREVVQVYTGLPGSAVERPVRELKGFASVDLEPGEGRTVDLRLPRADLAYWDTRVDRWIVEGGSYTVDVGASSRDLRLSARVEVPGDEPRLPLTRESTFAEVLAHPVAGPVLQERLGGVPGGDGGDGLGTDMAQMFASVPIGRFAFAVDESELERLLELANGDADGAAGERPEAGQVARSSGRPLGARELAAEETAPEEGRA